MMRLNIKWPFVGVMCGLTFLWAILPSGAGGLTGLNLITKFSGDVQVKSSKGSGYQKVYKNQRIRSDDFIKVNAKASAIVFCLGDLRQWQVPQGQVSRVSDGCPLGVATRSNPRNPNTPTRSGTDPRIPYVMSPRNTSILTASPLIQWHPVAGAKSYTVEIKGGGLTWLKKVAQSQVKYDGAPLKSGYYQIFVQTDNGASSREDPVGFTILGESEIKEIKAGTDRIQQQALDKEANVFALASFYRDNQLNTEAILVLEDFIKQGKATASVSQLLGEIYQQVGLPQLAQERFMTALAGVGDNIEWKANIQSSLGEVDTALGQEKEAKEWYQKAQAGYRTLNDLERVSELQQKIDAL